MNMSTHKGDLYEDLVSKFLAAKGWMILAKKYIGGGGEIDIIAVREGELCFIEVKGRDDIDGGYESIFASMTMKKQRALIACSIDFLQNYENQIIFDCCYFVLCGFVGEELFWIENPFDQEG